MDTKIGKIPVTTYLFPRLILGCYEHESVNKYCYFIIIIIVSIVFLIFYR